MQKIKQQHKIICDKLKINPVPDLNFYSFKMVKGNKIIYGQCNLKATRIDIYVRNYTDMLKTLIHEITHAYLLKHKGFEYWNYHGGVFWMYFYSFLDEFT